MGSGTENGSARPRRASADLAGIRIVFRYHG